MNGRANISLMIWFRVEYQSMLDQTRIACMNYKTINKPNWYKLICEIVHAFSCNNCQSAKNSARWANSNTGTHDFLQMDKNDTIRYVRNHSSIGNFRITLKQMFQFSRRNLQFVPDFIRWQLNGRKMADTTTCQSFKTT